ncbi:MAG: PucR family transcriptional regulator ligand-binding domain-containing protein [Negativicutes bacterium]|nr:PucR family transcriptional regulator ligand-binding domain-containing protein [Negativicutes bacterium]
MSLTIKEALAIHPLDKAPLIAGADGLDRRITLFGILDAPDSFKFVKPGELVVTTGYIFRDDPGLEDRILMELYERNAAGLGIKFNRYISRLSQKNIDYANEKNFPILSLPNEYSWHEISSPILINCLVDKHNPSNDIFDVLNCYSDKLVNISGFLGILKLIYDLTNNPCSLVSMLNKSTTVSYPVNFKPPRDIGSILENFPANAERLLPHSDIYAVQLDNASGNSVIVAQIKHYNNILTNILIWVNKTDLTHEQLIILQYAINSIKLRFHEFSGPRKDLLREQNDFLFRLLLEDVQNTDLVFSQANQLGLALIANYIVAVAEISAKSPTTIFTEEAIHDKLEDFFYQARNVFNVLCGFGKFGELFFLIPISSLNEATDPYKLARTKIADLKSSLEKHFSNMTFSFGVGKYHPKLSGLKRSFQEAVNALKLGTQVFGYGTVTLFNDLGVYRILNNTAIQPELTGYLQDYLVPLIEYDRQNKSELVKTLKIFLENNRSNRKCAQQMFVHHNTIRYRLEQIEQICHLNFDKTDHLLILELALKAIPLIELNTFSADGQSATTGK